MNRKKITLVLLLAGMTFLCVFAARTDARNASFCAGKFDRPAVRVRTNAYEEVINPYYREEDDIWYYFLPSGMDDKIIYNDTSDLPISIDGRTLEAFERFEWEEDRDYRVVYDNIYGHNEITARFVSGSAIPSVFIETGSKTMGPLNESKDNIEPGTITVYEADGSVSCHGTLTIKGRGNSTYYTFFKKPFNIKLDKKTCLLGMDKARDWCLLANAWDYSYMNNMLAYDMAAGAGFDFVPEAAYADVYFNGDYWGLYLITEKVEINENRLKITDLAELNRQANPGTDLALAEPFEQGDLKGISMENLPADITGGYLLERDYRIEPDYTRPVATNSKFRTKGYGTPINIRSPQNADIREVEYIRNLTSEMEQAVCSPEGISETGKSWQDYIDLDSWVKWYMIAEIAGDTDKGETSTFFYKDRDSADTKFHMGPVWDFDNAFGGHIEFTETDVLRKLGPGNWIEQLYDKPEFFEAVRREWQEYFRDYLVNEAPAKIDAWQELIRKSVALDNLRWWKNEGYQKYWPLTEGGYSSAYIYDREVDYLRTWLSARCQFLDTQWGSSR